MKTIDESNNIYTCWFCGKKEHGRPLSYLNPSARVDISGNFIVKLDGSNVALRPVGWDWDIVKTKFTNLWSCGCSEIRKKTI